MNSLSFLPMGPLCAVMIAAAAPFSIADLVIRDAGGVDLSLIQAGTASAPAPGFTAIRIANTGTVAVEGLSAATEGSAAADFNLTDLSATTIAPGAFVTARLKFKPSATGARTAVLRVSAASPAGQQATANLSGTGSNTVTLAINDPATPITLEPGVSGQVYDFGTMTLNFQPVDQAITIYPPGEFANAPAGGIVFGNHQGFLYPYRVTYALGPPPLRRYSMALSLALGAVMTSFDAKLNGGGGAVALQGDGRLIVTGGFSSVDGHSRQRMARLNADGSLDPSFLCSIDGVVESMAFDQQDRILICGYFQHVNGTPVPGLARLNVDGSLDGTFAPATNVSHGLRVIALPDGKVMLSGKRLNADGSVDPTFSPFQVSSPYNSFGVQKDGRIVANSDTLRRYHSDGTLDTSFNAQVDNVTSLAIQDDGKIVIGGHFDTVGGAPRQRVARLNADGTPDPAFTGNVVFQSGAVSCVAVEEDGGIIISGTFAMVDGQSRPGIARLRADGSLDGGFASNLPSSTITGMSLAADGSVFVTGTFSQTSGAARTGLAKLHNHPATTSFTVEGGGTLRWKRTGSAPALSGVTFSVSEDSGHGWTTLGAPVRSGDDWVLTGVSLSPHGFLRASGNSILSTRGCGSIRDTMLYGRQLNARETWRQAQLGSPLDEGVSADGYDYDHDGHVNLLEYAFALNPKLPDAHLLPAWQKAGGAYEMSFPKYLTIEGITYHPEWSETLRADDWHPGETVGDLQNNIFRIPAGTEERKFFRLRVANP